MTSLFDEIGLSSSRRTPAIVAAEAAECGLACLAMVARYHGHDVDLNGLRQRFSVSMAGTSLRALMTMADQISLSTRALKVEIESLPDLPLPAILHWDLNHFVVLTKIGAKEAVVHDPAIGRRALPLKEFSKHFTGVALELTPAEGFRPIAARSSVRLQQLWTRITGLRKALIELFILSAVLQVLTFAAPFQIQLIFDQVIYHADRDLLTVIAFAFGTLFVLQSITQLLRDRVVLIAGSLFGFQIVGNLVRHVLRLPSSYFERRHLGDILSRIRSSEPIRNAVTQGIVSAIIDGVMALLAVAILFAYSTLLASIVIVSMALYFGIMFLVYPAMKNQSLEQILAAAREQTNLMESLRAAVTIKVMGREVEREATWRNMYANVINTSLSLGKLQINTAAALSIITGLQTVIIIYLGAGMVMTGAGFSAGMLMAFLSFRQTFADRTGSLIDQVFQFRLLELHLDRLGDIIQSVPDAAEAAHTPFTVSGAIEVRNLSFRYGTSDPAILEDCSLAISPGEFVAITGASGCGKSTLLKLLLGLYQADNGEILLDGCSASPALWRSWRAQIGVVAQDDRLLSGTIADNIAFFDPDLQMEKVIQAARAVRIHDDIMRKPMQYLSLIGDMGSVLSVGQRQRILLARALYRDPRVLILDEGTANLDSRTEAEIIDLVESLPITRIVVAHGAALIERAATVYELADSRLHLVRKRETMEREAMENVSSMAHLVHR